MQDTIKNFKVKVYLWTHQQFGYSEKKELLTESSLNTTTHTERANTSWIEAEVYDQYIDWRLG